MSEVKNTSWLAFFWRVTACQITSYSLMGIIAYNLFDYRKLFSESILSVFMKPVDAPIVAAGPALQVVRGLLFALILWPFWTFILNHRRSWLLLWLLFIGLAILGTAGPSPGSLEGMIYTQVPFLNHLKGLPEVVLQTGLFSFLLVKWYQHPGKLWNIIMAILLCLVLFMGVMGYLAASGMLKVT
jgi:hypothetical protein